MSENLDLFISPELGQAENTPSKIRLLVVDDHAIVRRGLVLVLALEPGIEVIGEASNGLAAIKLAEQLKPDIILMDYKMPGMSGVAAGQAIKQKMPRCRILILTGLDTDTAILDALQNGVDGYVLKEITPDKLAQAVRAVAHGGAFLDPEVTRKVINRFNSRLTVPANLETPVLTTAWLPGLASTDGVEGLTERECEIVRNLSRGYSNREIAEILIVGEETVRTHLKSIYRKLGVNDRTQAVVVALKQGLIEL